MSSQAATWMGPASITPTTKFSFSSSWADGGVQRSDATKYASTKRHQSRWTVRVFRPPRCELQCECLLSQFSTVQLIRGCCPDAVWTWALSAEGQYSGFDWLLPTNVLAWKYGCFVYWFWRTVHRGCFLNVGSTSSVIVLVVVEFCICGMAAEQG